MRIVMTVCYLVKDGRILLGLKKMRLGQGLWNGFGGRKEEWEDIDTTAVRETEDECGLRPLDARRVGVVLVTKEGEEEEIELHLYVANRWIGELRSSNEMQPRWFFLTDVPYDEMWPSDRHFLPCLLEGMCFTGNFHLSSTRELLTHEFRTVDELPATI